jgi:molecular chaperone DnaK
MKDVYLGIDLGTSNSSCALFDTSELQVVRSSQGGNLTPSVVRITAGGQVITGRKAQRYLERDPANTRAEFKRLMGTEQEILFPASGQSRTPTLLSAAIIAALLDDVEQQFNFRPTRAMVTVPALFDLPQSNATAEAAKAAGLEKIELLQEPVASALAAGWNEASLQQSWLVFDLGGGTFDASLLEYRDGMLRVIAHDGDNFLGGRDFDKALADWAITSMADQHGIIVEPDSTDPEQQQVLRLLTLAAEEAKIDLSSREATELNLFSDIALNGQLLELDLPIDRSTFEALCMPLLDRALAICEKLLRENNVRQGSLDQVVLVGGPSMMPLIRRQVAARLAPIASGSLDPMTLVAQGAALYAASTGLTAVQQNDQREKDKPEQAENKFVLQHPTMSSDLQPVVLGRLMEKCEPLPASICLRNQTGNWCSEKTPVQDDVFMVGVELQPRTCNTFSLQAYAADGSRVPVLPEQLSIVHGLSISDPPLSRSIGVALTNGMVRNFFERGTPLPVKRTFTHHSVETLLPNAADQQITIPIVQGEFRQARYCRAIGSLIIRTDDLQEPLLAGAAIEISLELDRGGNLQAQAFVPAISRVFTGVLHLIVAGADLTTLRSEAGALRLRLADLQQNAFKQNRKKQVSRYIGWQNELEEAERDLALLQGNDQDAGQRAGHSLTGLAARIDREEAVMQLEQRCREDELGILYDCDWISEYGTEQEKGMLSRALQTIEQAAEQKNLTDYSRQREIINKLGSTAFERSEEAWIRYFESAAARGHEATDLKKADSLVQRGWQAVEANQQAKLKEIVQRLWDILPADAQTRQESFDSGIR